MRVKEAEGAEIASTPRPAGSKEAGSRRKQKEAEAREKKQKDVRDV